MKRQRDGPFVKESSGLQKKIHLLYGMRMARIKIESKNDRAVYHCVSRIVDRRFIFGEVEKNMFVQFLREYEQFCGVQLLKWY